MNISNKKMAFLGDSITAGGIVSDQKYIYWKLFEQNDNCTVVGYGKSATRIAKQQDVQTPDYDNAYFVTRVPDMDDDIDVIVVFGGTNDYGHGDAAMGTMSDRTDDTFYGALHNLYTALINKFPSSTIVIMTPTHRLDENCVYNERGVRNVSNFEGYVNAITDVAAYYGLPVLDLYRTSGMNPENETIRQKYMPDGLHPSDDGHRLIYERLKGFLTSL